MFVFLDSCFWSSLAYELAEQEPNHCLTPGFLIPLEMSQIAVLPGKKVLISSMCGHLATLRLWKQMGSRDLGQKV